MRIGLVGTGRIGAFHAETLRDLPEVTRLVLADADPARAGKVADTLGVECVDDPTTLLLGSGPAGDLGIDGLVVATPTHTHAALVTAAAEAGAPVFVEKPVAPDVAGTRRVLARVAQAGIPLQVGFQRRFDPGFCAVREAVAAGRLGWLHSVRSCTCDPAPPSAAYVATSGGIFRDCGVHDIDAVRWVTGHEVVEVYATGANRGAAFFTEARDVDTAAAVCTLDDGTLATVSVTRYNGAGYDVRLEVCGSEGTQVAGLDDRVPLTSADPGATWPRGPAYAHFMERFSSAYAAELRAFTEVVAGTRPSPCTGEEALAALLVAEAADVSLREKRVVRVTEVSG
ncbi:MAG: Gfo/Idh/MocA family protein [Actinomycetes bacterium]